MLYLGAVRRQPLTRRKSSEYRESGHL